MNTTVKRNTRKTQTKN